MEHSLRQSLLTDIHDVVLGRSQKKMMDVAVWKMKRESLEREVQTQLPSHLHTQHEGNIGTDLPVCVNSSQCW